MFLLAALYFFQRNIFSTRRFAPGTASEGAQVFEGTRVTEQGRSDEGGVKIKCSIAP